MHSFGKLTKKQQVNSNLYIYFVYVYECISFCRNSLSPQTLHLNIFNIPFFTIKYLFFFYNIIYTFSFNRKLLNGILFS